MGVPGGSGEDTDQNLPESYYRELQSAEWADGPSRVPDHIAPNEHLATLYDDETVMFTLQFLRGGLEREQPCLYLTADYADTDIQDDLTTADLDIDTTDTLDNLEVREISELGLDGETDSSDELFEALKRTISAVSRPERKTRVVVEMDGLLDTVPFPELLEYEARLNRLCRKNDVVVLSQYYRNRTDPAKLSELLAVYPYVVVDGTVCYNTHYLPPSTFFSQKRADREVQQRIETLRQHTETRLTADEERQRNEQLKVFANSIAHDLRNPLQTAIGRTELLPENEDQIAVVQDALERMERLIDDGLEMVLGDELADSETASFEDLANRCWSVIDAGDASLVVTEDFLVTGDTSRIQQLLKNLFRNSIEHGGPSPAIRVGPIEQIHLATRAGTDAGYTGFFVEDDGPGIPEDRREEIFELGVSKGDGTGYGLAIVREIVEAHGWQIHVTAGADGGARFEITGADALPP